VETVPGWEIGAIAAAIEKAAARKGVSVIIVRQRCALLVQRERRAAGEKAVPCIVSEDRCKGCFVCLSKFGCPAMRPSKKRMTIDSDTCTGCGACLDPSVCPEGAIECRKGGI